MDASNKSITRNLSLQDLQNDRDLFTTSKTIKSNRFR